MTTLFQMQINVVSLLPYSRFCPERLIISGSRSDRLIYVAYIVKCHQYYQDIKNRMSTKIM